jgi:hypothetical protein
MPGILSIPAFPGIPGLLTGYTVSLGSERTFFPNTAPFRYALSLQITFTLHSIRDFFTSDDIFQFLFGQLIFF